MIQGIPTICGGGRRTVHMHYHRAVRWQAKVVAESHHSLTSHALLDHWPRRSCTVCRGRVADAGRPSIPEQAARVAIRSHWNIKSCTCSAYPSGRHESRGAVGLAAVRWPAKKSLIPGTIEISSKTSSMRPSCSYDCYDIEQQNQTPALVTHRAE
jgi:hypothetical protein